MFKVFMMFVVIWFMIVLVCKQLLCVVGVERRRVKLVQQMILMIRWFIIMKVLLVSVMFWGKIMRRMVDVKSMDFGFVRLIERLERKDFFCFVVMFLGFNGVCVLCQVCIVIQIRQNVFVILRVRQVYGKSVKILLSFKSVSVVYVVVMVVRLSLIVKF